MNTEISRLRLLQNPWSDIVDAASRRVSTRRDASSTICTPRYCELLQVLRLISIAIVVLAAACPVMGMDSVQETGTVETTPVPSSADQWLAAVRARLPQQPTWIIGWLSTDSRPMLNVNMLLDLGHDPPMARYTLQDAFGRDLMELTLWRDPQQTRMRYRRGSPLMETPAPDLFAPIENTAMSWGDLSLSFLWWPDGEIVGHGEVRGQECVIVEVAAPDEEAGMYDHVRIWIDLQHRMLLQAEGYDVRGQRVRRMQVRSFRQIGDEWMVKDIVIQRYPGILRTNLRVRDMGEVERNNDLD